MPGDSVRAALHRDYHPQVVSDKLSPQRPFVWPIGKTAEVFPQRCRGTGTVLHETLDHASQHPIGQASLIRRNFKTVACCVPAEDFGDFGFDLGGFAVGSGFKPNAN